MNAEMWQGLFVYIFKIRVQNNLYSSYVHTNRYLNMYREEVKKKKKDFYKPNKVLPLALLTTGAKVKPKLPGENLSRYR